MSEWRKKDAARILYEVGRASANPPPPRPRTRARPKERPMAETLRGVTVSIEVDTNKNTYPLILTDVDIATAEREIAEFFAHMEDL